MHRDNRFNPAVEKRCKSFGITANQSLLSQGEFGSTFKNMASTVHANVPEEGWTFTLLRLRPDGPEDRLAVVLEEVAEAKGEDGRMTVQVSSGMSSKQTTVLPVGGRGAAGFSKFLFTPLFGSRQ